MHVTRYAYVRHRPISVRTAAYTSYTYVTLEIRETCNFPRQLTIIYARENSHERAAFGFHRTETRRERRLSVKNRRLIGNTASSRGESCHAEVSQPLAITRFAVATISFVARADYTINPRKGRDSLRLQFLGTKTRLSFNRMLSVTMTIL